MREGGEKESLIARNSDRIRHAIVFGGEKYYQKRRTSAGFAGTRLQNSDDRMYARFTFSLRHLIAKRGTSWTLLKACRRVIKASGKSPCSSSSPSSLFANRRHIPTLIFFSATILFTVVPPLPLTVHRLRSPARVFPEPVSPPDDLPPPPHKKYNIFLSFDPTTSPCLPCPPVPPCLLVSLCAWRICKFNSTRKSERVCATTARSGRLDCFVLWDSNMNYKPAPWLLRSRCLLILTPDRYLVVFPCRMRVSAEKWDCYKDIAFRFPPETRIKTRR